MRYWLIYPDCNEILIGSKKAGKQVICLGCNKEIDIFSEPRIFATRGCTKLYHMKCFGSRKTEVKAKKIVITEGELDKYCK